VTSRTTALGGPFALATAVVWGGQFVVGKSALEDVGAFPLSTIRYAIAAALWLLVLAVLEGRGA
jgi:drug/metabolite transporter (DMT)-like permease